MSESVLPRFSSRSFIGSTHEMGCSGLVHWDDPEGWDGEGDGKGVQDGEHMYMADSCQCMAKTTTIL